MFGTDGVRGAPGRYPLDAETVSRLGAAATRELGPIRPRLVIARDTRESGPAIEQQLARGVLAEHGTPISAGVLPTPAAAWLASTDDFDGAFVISASHNPFPDNGIKVVTGDGKKASSELEARITERVTDASWQPDLSSAPILESRDMVSAYAGFLRSVLPSDVRLGHMRVAIDCANGATSTVAPDLFRDLGLDVVVCHADPDGRNINQACGSTHPQSLVEVVRTEGCHLGLAFDGDGDRVILVDADGKIVDGDGMLFVCASHLKSEGRLPGDGIVATVMSNIGLEVALRGEGIEMHRCPVGDRSVWEAMERFGVALGGEQSGHIIFSDRLPTGDGLATALSVIRVMHATGRELADLGRGLAVFPQLLLNVEVRHKPDLSTEPALVELIDHAEQTLGQDGRVLVRYSGTEPILRVMIEGRDVEEVQRLATSIADCAKDRLGGDTIANT